MTAARSPGTLGTNITLDGLVAVDGWRDAPLKRIGDLLDQRDIKSKAAFALKPGGRVSPGRNSMVRVSGRTGGPEWRAKSRRGILG